MNCPSCSKENPDGALFCVHCNAALDVADNAPALGAAPEEPSNLAVDIDIEAGNLRGRFSAITNMARGLVVGNMWGWLAATLMLIIITSVSVLLWQAYSAKDMLVTELELQKTKIAKLTKEKKSDSKEIEDIKAQFKIDAEEIRLKVALEVEDKLKTEHQAELKNLRGQISTLDAQSPSSPGSGTSKEDYARLIEKTRKLAKRHTEATQEIARLKIQLLGYTGKLKEKPKKVASTKNPAKAAKKTANKEKTAPKKKALKKTSKKPVSKFTFSQDKVLRGHSSWVYSVSFSPDGNLVASGSKDRSVKIWDANKGVLLHTLTGHQNWVPGVAFSPDGKRIASASWDKTIKLWDVQSGAQIRTFRGHTNWVRAVAFSPNGKLLASGSTDKSIILWDPETGKLLRTLTGHQQRVRTLVFSADSKQLYSGSWDQTIRVWDSNTGALINTLKGHTDSINSIAISKDGKTLASASADETIRLWNAATGKHIRTIFGHQQAIHTVSFSPDGRWLASGSSDKTIRVWDTKSGKQLGLLLGHQDWVPSVAFAPDGHRIVSGGTDNAIIIWKHKG